MLGGAVQHRGRGRHGDPGDRGGGASQPERAPRSLSAMPQAKHRVVAAPSTITIHSVAVGITSPVFSMRVSSRAHYSLRMMTELAKAYGRGPVSLSEVGRVEYLPVAYLEQLAGQLRRAGLLESTRGAHGGYALARSPEVISVLDVLEVVEGEVAPVECLSHDYAAGSCERDGECASRGLWARLKISVEDVFRGTTLRQLIDDHSLMHDLGPQPDFTALTPLLARPQPLNNIMPRGATHV